MMSLIPGIMIPDPLLLLVYFKANLKENVEKHFKFIPVTL